MDAARFRAAYRTALALGVLYAVWTAIPYLSSYAGVVAGDARRAPGREVAPRPGARMKAADLEAALRTANRLGPDAQLRCTPGREWDYVCSYLPAAQPSPRRLQFGVDVDARRWLKVSAVVPVGTALPGPQ